MVERIFISKLNQHLQLVSQSDGLTYKLLQIVYTGLTILCMLKCFNV
jgi:hypothetical protein